MEHQRELMALLPALDEPELERSQQGTDVHSETRLFHELAGERVRSGLAELDVPARKVRMAVRAIAAEQDVVMAPDQGPGQEFDAVGRHVPPPFHVELATLSTLSPFPRRPPMAAKRSDQASGSSAPARRLGRGLSSLIDLPQVPVQVAAPAEVPGRADERVPVESGGSPLRNLPVTQISPSPYQPRREIDSRHLDELAASIRRSGLMQPVIVRERAVGEYELVAGERRWRAAQLAGLAEVPALVRELSDSDAAEWAIVENVQREDLNAMEKAWAFKALGERFGLSHAEIAARVGLDRSSIANLVRLTELEEEIAALITHGKLSGGHGKALLQAPAGAGRIVLAKRASEEGWSVRRLEAECTGAAARAVPAAAVGGVGTMADVDRRRRAEMLGDLERQLGEHLGTKVTISTKFDGKKGKIEVQFFDLDHFDDVTSRMGFRMR